MRNIFAGIKQHGQGFQNPLDLKRFGQTGKVTFTCKKNHIVTTDSSQYLPGGMFFGQLKDDSCSECHWTKIQSV